MIQIKQVHKESIQELIDIYDSANLLFESNLRASGTYDIFDKLTDDDTFILYENNVPKAFISYQVHKSYINIKGLYVKLDCQKNGYGKILLRYVENKDYFHKDILDNSPYNNVFILSVLKNAVWAIKFYETNGYSEISDIQISELGLEEIHFNNWSNVMIKIVDKHKSSCCCHNI